MLLYADQKTVIALNLPDNRLCIIKIKLINIIALKGLVKCKKDLVTKAIVQVG